MNRHLLESQKSMISIRTLQYSIEEGCVLAMLAVFVFFLLLFFVNATTETVNFGE